jgi:hypothetical protein
LQEKPKIKKNYGVLAGTPTNMNLRFRKIENFRSDSTVYVLIVRMKVKIAA